MADLSELHFKTSYHKGRDNIAADFYLPCMARASEYDRAVAFFRSAVFIIAWPALKDFIRRQGRIRLLCSQVLAAEDVDALSSGYSARADAVLASRLFEEVKGLLHDEVLRAPARILAALVAKRSLEFKIAIMKPEDVGTARGRLFHDKLGIFRDDQGHLVIFKGSMNETWRGLSSDGNLESIDVAASWMGARDLERARTEEAYFRDLWTNNYPTLHVRDFPEVARSELEKASDNNWEDSLSTLLKSENADGPQASKRTLRPHQAAGLASWRANNRCGILDFATGSGKTLTAITAIRECLHQHNEAVLVVVPDQTLFEQWYRELRNSDSDLRADILRAGAGHDLWRNNLSLWTRPGDMRRIVLATIQTAANADFRVLLAGGTHLALVVDEVHRLGSPHHRQLMQESLFGPRLGLSATPERAGDPDGTSALLAFFRGVLEPRYGLVDAIRDGVLCKYFYRPHVVYLNETETAEWTALSAQIGQILGRSRADPTEEAAQRVKHLLIRRARVVKQAEGKVALATTVVRENYEIGQRWIVYCDDLGQLNEVCTAFSQLQIRCLPYHSQMDGDRSEALRWFENRGGVMVAIKCLDEGVDIPSVTHALILASSKNPREFIQRRGRVLRMAPNKPFAHIHDAIVLPAVKEGGVVDGLDPITIGELARAVEFARHSENPAAASDLLEIALVMRVDLPRMVTEGSEDDRSD